MQLAVGIPVDAYLCKKLSNRWGGLGCWSAKAKVAKIPVIDN